MPKRGIIRSVKKNISWLKGIGKQAKRNIAHNVVQHTPVGKVAKHVVKTTKANVSTLRRVVSEGIRDVKVNAPKAISEAKRDVERAVYGKPKKEVTKGKKYALPSAVRKGKSK